MPGGDPARGSGMRRELRPSSAIELDKLSPSEGAAIFVPGSANS